MKWRIVVHVLGALCILVAVALLPSVGFAVTEAGDAAVGWRTLRAFGLSALGAALAGGLLLWATRGAGEERFTAAEGFAVAALGWVLMGLLGALPLWLCVNPGAPPPGCTYATPGMSPGPGFGYVDACFESMSGFSTTGSSVFGSPRDPVTGAGIGMIEALPRSFLFWRSLTHWLGGMGIVVLCLALLPTLRAGVYQMFQAEVPGPTADRLMPRVRQTAAILWGVYVLLTVVQTALLWLGDMPLFDALCHTFGTLATGGFSTKDASIGFYATHPNGLYLELVIDVFMFLAGANFLLHFQALKGNPGCYRRNDEFRFYCLVLGAAILCVVVGLRVAGTGPATLGGTVRVAVFQVVSVMTTTGFGTADFNLWPGMLRVLLVGLMFLGGCAGSTGGGIKQIRIMVAVRYVHRALERLIRPGLVKLVRVGPDAMEEHLVANVMSLVVLWFAVFGVATLAVTGLLEGVVPPGADPACAGDGRLVTAATAVAATLNNIGPGLSGVGSTCNFGWMPASAKVVLALCMLLGRLEIYTVVIVFLPLAWRR